MENKTLCPKCGKDNFVFCGLKSDGKGSWLNSWECLEPDCQNKWTTEINKEIIKEFRS